METFKAGVPKAVRRSDLSRQAATSAPTKDRSELQIWPVLGQSPSGALAQVGASGEALARASPLAALVDELGELDLEIAPLKWKIKRADALRLLLRNAFKGEPGDKSFSVEGSKWTLLLSACGNVSSVDAAKLASIIGADAFLGLADVSLKALAELPAEVVAAVVSTAQTGTRSLCVVPAPPVPTAVKMAAKRGRR